MSINIFMKNTFMSGLLFLIVGLIFLVWSTVYQSGSASKMGPGYFPMLLAVILICLGFLNLVKSYLSKEVKIPINIAWRPLILILLSNILFGVLLPSLGLVIAIFALVIVSSSAMSGIQLKEAILLSTLLSVIGCIVFVWLLGMPLLIFPGV